MGRAPLPAYSFGREAGCRLMRATRSIGCEREPWPRVKGEDAASWMKDAGCSSANFAAIRRGAGKCISSDWVYQKDLWGLWAVSTPRSEDALSQSWSPYRVMHRGLRKVLCAHGDPWQWCLITGCASSLCPLCTALYASLCKRGSSAASQVWLLLLIPYCSVGKALTQKR